MYKKILVTLDGTFTDRAIIEHVKQLAQMTKSCVVLLHVADGWAARMFGSDAIGPEVNEDMEYLEKVKKEFIAVNVEAETELAYGEPAAEIIKRVKKGDCNLVAMSTHGHRFISDLFLGATATRVRHGVNVPVLLLKAK